MTTFYKKAAPVRRWTLALLPMANGCGALAMTSWEIQRLGLQGLQGPMVPQAQRVLMATTVRLVRLARLVPLALLERQVLIQR
jgi:hypothetical protein